SGEPGLLNRRNVLEVSVAQVVKEKHTLRVRGAPVLFVSDRIDMPVDEHQIEPSVVVVVEKAGSPAQKRDGLLAQSGMERDFGKICVAFVVKQELRFVGEIADGEIEQTVI